MSEYYYNPGQTSGTTFCECCGTDGVTNSCSAAAQTPNSTVIDTGQFTFELSLLSAGGWSFGISYQSGGAAASILGPGFNFTNANYLSEDVDGSILLHNPNHTVERFEKVGETYSSLNNNTRAALSRVTIEGVDYFKIVSSAGMVSLFSVFDAAAPGRLVSIADRYGSVKRFSWTRTGGLDQLQSVTDAFGRTVVYRYFGSEQGYQLREIEDFLGRKLNFQYDSSNRLVAVVTPSVTRAADGRGFPGGTAYVFQYDAQNPREERRNDLIRIWHPNQTLAFLDESARTVDVEAVYTSAQERTLVEYGQDPTDADFYGRVIRETAGRATGGEGGTWSFLYTTDAALLPSNPFDAGDPITRRTVVTDPNGNQTIYDFNAARMGVRVEVLATRSKLSLPGQPLATSYVTWTRYNEHNQPELIIYPEGNSVEYVYESGQVDGAGGSWTNPRRIGLLRSVTRRPGNAYGLNNPVREGSNGQTELTQRFFYDPIFNQQCAVIESRGNPVDAGAYFVPQNEGAAPSDADRSRYATVSFLDYQKNQLATVTGNAALQARLGLDAAGIADLIASADAQMKAADGTGGLPAGFQMDLGDVNGDGTGDGAGSGLPAANILGSVVKVQHPAVRQLVPSQGSDPWEWALQERAELFTTNLRGQTTTHTDPEGNLTVYVRYPENDPEGDAQFVAAGLSTKQYGQLKEVHVDADPDDVMSLVGADGDLADFIGGKIARTGSGYLDLVTRYAGQAGAGGCSTCAYDALGNVLSQTDPRGFTTTFDRDELGRVFRTTAPAPYHYRTETRYDANGNAVRVDVEDRVVQFMTDDPTSANFAKFLPTGSGSVAHVPSRSGPGGSLRRGWFTHLYTFNLLDRKVQDDLDAAGSTPGRLVTAYEYDANGNLVRLTRPEGNTVEYDYDERNLQIAQRVGLEAGEEDQAAVTVTVYDRNGQALHRIGAADRLGGAGSTTLTAVLEDAFRTGQPMTHIGTWEVENTYDGFGRLIQAKDAVGAVSNFTYDPDGRVIGTQQEGTVGGATPADRTGASNVTLASSLTRFDEAGRTCEAEQAVFLNTGFEMIAPAVEPPLPAVASPTHTLLSGRAVSHTGGGLAANSTANSHTGTATLTAGGQSYVLSRSVYDRAGRVIVSANDKGALTRIAYDGAGRQVRVTDPLGNVVETVYDAGGNAVRTRRTEIATLADPPAGLAAEVFESFACYDALGRLVVAGSQGADGSMSTAVVPWPTATQTLLTRFGYDSRSNRTVVIDAKGNTALTVFDGAGRAVQSVQHLRAGGAGGPPEDGTTFLADGGASIRTTSVFDANGRLVELIDDRGGTTLFAYDGHDRQTSMIFHDGSTRTTAYNPASDIVSYQDENGSLFTFTYDALGRKTALAVAHAAAGVAAGSTSAQTFAYDGLSRMVASSDTAASIAQASFAFDSLGRCVEERQAFAGQTRYVTRTSFASLADSGFMLPSGRALAYDHDVMYRRTEVREGVDAIASWSFFGPARVAEVTLGNGLVLTHMNNARTRSAVQDGQAAPAWGDAASDRLGYDGAGRMICKRFLAAGLDPLGKGYASTAAMAGFTTAFDKASNKLYERHLHAENRSHLYPAQDSLGRLLQVRRGTLAQDAYGQVAVASPIALDGADSDRTYTLDGLGNWRRTARTPAGQSEPVTEVRQHNLLNQLLKFGPATVAYDHGDNDQTPPGGDPPTPEQAARGNGNIVNDGTRRYAYDVFNRLIAVTRDADSALLARYTYDALGRRIRKVVADLGGGLGGLSGDIPAGTTDYLYDGVQCVEERDPLGGGGSTDTPLRQYVWGIYVDELVQQKELAGATPPTYYPLADLLYRTHALTDSPAAGPAAIVETYDYDAYGNTRIFASPGPDLTWFTDDDASAATHHPRCRYLFTGREYDGETEVYYYRARSYSSRAGRMVSRDSSLYWDGCNLYSYASSCPLVYVDWSGNSTTITNGCGAVGASKSETYSWKDKIYPFNPRWWNSGDWVSQKTDFLVSVTTITQWEIGIAGPKGPPAIKGGPAPAGRGSLITFETKSVDYLIPSAEVIGRFLHQHKVRSALTGAPCRKAVFLSQNCCVNVRSVMDWILGVPAHVENRTGYRKVYLHGTLNVPANSIPIVAFCDVAAAEASLDSLVQQVNQQKSDICTGKPQHNFAKIEVTDDIQLGEPANTEDYKKGGNAGLVLYDWTQYRISR